MLSTGRRAPRGIAAFVALSLGILAIAAPTYVVLSFLFEDSLERVTVVGATSADGVPAITVGKRSAGNIESVVVSDAEGVVWSIRAVETNIAYVFPIGSTPEGFEQVGDKRPIPDAVTVTLKGVGCRAPINTDFDLAKSFDPSVVYDGRFTFPGAEFESDNKAITRNYGCRHPVSGFWVGALLSSMAVGVALIILSQHMQHRHRHQSESTDDHSPAP